MSTRTLRSILTTIILSSLLHIPLTVVADVLVNVSLTPPLIVSGKTVVYAISVTNQGPDQAVDITISNTLPPAVRLLTLGISGGGSCSNGDGIVTGEIPMLVNGGIATLTMTGEVFCATPSGALLTNTVFASTSSSELQSANNQVTIITTNGNSAKAKCGNTISFSESLADRFFCTGNKSVGIYCEVVSAQGFNIAASLSLIGQPTGALNASTVFNLAIGNYSVSHKLGDDPHYGSTATSATFVDFSASGYNFTPAYQIIHLKWNAQSLTVTISGKAPDASYSTLGWIDVFNFDGSNSEPITDTIQAAISLGGASLTFNPISVTGFVQTRYATAKDQSHGPLSKIQIKGSGSL